MKEKFSKIPANTFKQLGVNAAMVLSDFDPDTGVVADSDIIGATTGGVNFNAAPEYTDWGEDIDNCPKNTKELKKVAEYEVKASGTFVTVDTASAKLLIGAASITGDKITPLMDLDADNDFADIWIIGDYSDQNGDTNGGFVACHIINALSTGGFSLVTADEEKGKFAFEFTGHVSIEDQGTVPFELYIHAGTAEPT